VTTPYLGYNGSITIGYSPLVSTTYFSNYIDNVALITRAKSSTEILADATQLWYFSFDLPNPYYDNGPNRLNGTAYSITSVTGHNSIGQAIRMTTTSSYFQLYGISSYSYPTSKPYTYAMWVYPSSNLGGVLVHVSYSQPGYNYQQELLGLTYSGQLVTQVNANTPVSAYPSVIGPVISINTWTHVACTYSMTNGLTLYVNGVSQGSTGSNTVTSYYLIPNYVYLTLGYSFGYGNNYIPAYPFQGSIDEFYAYSRQLSASEIYTLASI
ncbi:unnamed protein product, partial [Didymodactylos carnosus]